MYLLQQSSNKSRRKGLPGGEQQETGALESGWGGGGGGCPACFLPSHWSMWVMKISSKEKCMSSLERRNHLVPSDFDAGFI